MFVTFRSYSVQRHLSQDLLQLVLLLCRERLREFDSHTDNEITTLVGLLALWHAKTGEMLCEVGPRWTTAADWNLFPVNGLNSSLPAGQGFFEIEFDDMLDIVAFAGEKRMWFLCLVSV